MSEKGKYQSIFSQFIQSGLDFILTFFNPTKFIHLILSLQMN